MNYHTFKIEKEYNSIYYFLKENGFSENFISNLRKDWGNFVVNNEIVNIRKPLQVGDKLKVNNSPNDKTDIMQCILPLDIVYEDAYYLLINKPSNLSCMPTKSHYSNNLAGAVCHYMQEKDQNFVVRILNRLDKDTAGIIIVAKDSISQNKISDIEKEYHAICIGEIRQPILIDKPIKTKTSDGINQHKRIISADGKPASTMVRPLKHANNLTLISATLTHGRTHQIRLHLSSINHPLVGDTIYGEGSKLIDHSALICKKVSFNHPFLNKTLSFEVDYPSEFKSVLSNFNLTNKSF